MTEKDGIWVQTWRYTCDAVEFKITVDCPIINVYKKSFLLYLSSRFLWEHALMMLKGASSYISFILSFTPTIFLFDS